MAPSTELLRALMVTAELCQTPLTEEAARVWVQDLGDYPEPQILEALKRCRREVAGQLRPADVIRRIQDGRPGADEAWSMLPRSEAESTCWTAEMAEAWGIAVPLMDSDETAARFAFRDAYQRLVSESRERAEPVRWSVTLGWDQAGREPVVRRALEQGRISREQAERLLPDLSFADAPRLGGPSRVGDIARLEVVQPVPEDAA